jgi:hypothetical protein
MVWEIPALPFAGEIFLGKRRKAVWQPPVPIYSHSGLDPESHGLWEIPAFAGKRRI